MESIRARTTRFKAAGVGAKYNDANNNGMFCLRSLMNSVASLIQMSGLKRKTRNCSLNVIPKTPITKTNSIDIMYTLLALSERGMH